MKETKQTLLEISRHITASHPELDAPVEQLSFHKANNRNQYAHCKSLGKAAPNNFLERYREIVSDPLNLLIRRVPESGYVDKHGCVILHNGNRVPLSGEFAYYAGFSDILVINRGVHEPLEEFCFQKTIEQLKLQPKPVMMIELGAYWAHYSMWLMKEIKGARCVMVEPQIKNLACGKNNFHINGFEGEWLNNFVGNGGFELDKYLQKQNISTLSILHSDIQGHETQMIEGAKDSLINRKVDYIFISTHSQEIHTLVIYQLINVGYRVEVSSEFERHTTSFDGFVMASSPNVSQVFTSFNPLGRQEIARASPRTLVNFVHSVAADS